MISKVIKLKLQCFIHVYVQATCQRHQEVYAIRHDPKYTLTLNLGFLPQIIYGYALGSTLHSDLETVGDSPGPKM